MYIPYNGAEGKITHCIIICQGRAGRQDVVPSLPSSERPSLFREPAFLGGAGRGSRRPIRNDIARQESLNGGLVSKRDGRQRLEVPLDQAL